MIDSERMTPARWILGFCHWTRAIVSGYGRTHPPLSACILIDNIPRSPSWGGLGDARGAPADSYHMPEGVEL